MKGIPPSTPVSFMTLETIKNGQSDMVRAAYLEPAPNLLEARRDAYRRFGHSGHWGYVARHDDNGEAIIYRRWSVADDILPPPRIAP